MEHEGAGGTVGYLEHRAVEARALVRLHRVVAATALEDLAFNLIARPVLGAGGHEAPGLVEHGKPVFEPLAFARGSRAHAHDEVAEAVPVPAQAAERAVLERQPIAGLALVADLLEGPPLVAAVDLLDEGQIAVDHALPYRPVSAPEKRAKLLHRGCFADVVRVVFEVGVVLPGVSAGSQPAVLLAFRRQGFPDGCVGPIGPDMRRSVRQRPRPLSLPPGSAPSASAGGRFAPIEPSGGSGRGRWTARSVLFGSAGRSASRIPSGKAPEVDVRTLDARAGLLQAGQDGGRRIAEPLPAHSPPEVRGVVFARDDRRAHLPVPRVQDLEQGADSPVPRALLAHVVDDEEVAFDVPPHDVEGWARVVERPLDLPEHVYRRGNEHALLRVEEPARQRAGKGRLSRSARALDVEPAARTGVEVDEEHGGLVAVDDRVLVARRYADRAEFLRVAPVFLGGPPGLLLFLRRPLLVATAPSADPDDLSGDQKGERGLPPPAMQASDLGRGRVLHPHFGKLRFGEAAWLRSCICRSHPRLSSPWGFSSLYSLAELGSEGVVVAVRAGGAAPRNFVRRSPFRWDRLSHQRP